MPTTAVDTRGRHMTSNERRTLIVHAVEWFGVILCVVAGITLMTVDAIDRPLGDGTVLGGLFIVIGAISACGLGLRTEVRAAIDAAYREGVSDGRACARVVDMARPSV
jgi:hypothetical protein